MIVKIVDGKIENFFEQLGVDVPQPQFSWAFAGTGYDECQTKYRLMVAQTEQNLHSGVHLHYDSGIVESDNTIAITYEGVPLDDVTKYYWKVQVWDQSDTQLESEVYSFVTGKIADPWTGQWIGNGTAKPFYARKSYAFTKEIQEAYKRVCLLYQFIFYINGNKVGDHELDPGWTNYHKIIQYVTFDITELLTDGANVFGMEVANGWYVPDEGGKYYVQTPKIKWISTLSDRFQDGGDGKRVFANILSALAEIHIIYTDGTRAVIGTDASWKTRESPTQKSLELVLDERGFVCGEVSLPYVLQTLKAMGDSQRIFEFVTRDEHPSYYRFVVQGETTLPEFWTDTARSRNHDMLGHIVEWFYNGMAGIASQNDAFKEISICPSLPNGVDRLQCGYQSVRGYIEVTVDRDDTGSTVHITLPPNTSAAVDLSKIDSRLTHAYIEQLDVQTDVSMLSLSSGTYTILLSQLNSLCR